MDSVLNKHFQKVSFILKTALNIDFLFDVQCMTEYRIFYSIALQLESNGGCVGKSVENRK